MDDINAILLKALKSKLAEAIKDNNTVDYKDKIDEFANLLNGNEVRIEDFYEEFSGGEGSFDEQPLMALLFNGNEELFQYTINKIPNIDLSQCFSALHRKINVASLPCMKEGYEEVDEVKLAGSHKILNFLNEKLSFEDKKKIGILNLACFFLNDSLVSNLIKHDRLYEIANFKGARDAKPINYAASLYDCSVRSRNIFRVLYSKNEIKSDFVNNPNILQNMLDNKMFGIVIELLHENLIAGDDLSLTSSYTALLNGIHRFAKSKKNVEKKVLNTNELESLTYLINKITCAQKDEKFIIHLNCRLDLMPWELQIIFTSALLSKIRPGLENGSVSIARFYEDFNESLCNVISNNNYLLSSLKLCPLDKDLFYSPISELSQLYKMIDHLSSEVRMGNLNDLEFRYKISIKQWINSKNVSFNQFGSYSEGVECSLANLGRNMRYELAFKVHNEVCLESFAKRLGRDKIGLGANIFSRCYNAIYAVPKVMYSSVSSLLSLVPSTDNLNKPLNLGKFFSYMNAKNIHESKDLHSKIAR